MYYKNHNRAIDCGLLSRFAIKSSKTYSVDLRFRPIHKIKLKIEKKDFTLFLNHWPSYKHGVKKRLEFAKKKLQNIIKLSQDMAIGIVLFSKDSYILSPITEDIVSLEYIINNINTKLNLNNG